MMGTDNRNNLKYKFYTWNGKDKTARNQQLSFYTNINGNFENSHSISEYKNQIDYWEPFNDTIYKFTDGILSDKICIDFGNKKLSQSFLNKPLDEKLNILQSENPDVRLLINNVIEPDGFLYFTFIGLEGKINCVYDKSLKECFLFDTINSINNIRHTGHFNALANEKYAYSILKLSTKEGTLFKIGDYDNPVIVLYRIK